MAELPLGSEPDAVPRARRFAVAALSDQPDTLVDDAALIVTELLTNAVLHGEPPVTLRVRHLDERVRVEVEDAGRKLPVKVRHSTEAMTGRGLPLVAALAAAWGVDARKGGGKAVWAELDPDAPTTPLDQAPEVDLDAFLAAWPDDEPDDETRYTIRLGAVPTDLLLAAKAHIDNVVREFTLARGDSAHGDPEMQRHFSELIETVTHGFADARAEIKRQAVEAAARGDVHTDLVLTLPLSAADAGEQYLLALDEADGYARGARLLTLATPPAHRVFRQWYVQSLVDQLRAQAIGVEPPALRTFPQRLADEVEDLAVYREAWDRLQLLQKVTADLTTARTVEEIARVVVDSAHDDLGAISARVYLLVGDMLESVAAHGEDPVRAEAYPHVPVSADLPGSVVVRTGRPMLLRNVAQILEQFPALSDIYAGATERILHVAPLIVGEHTLGVLSLTFPGGGHLGEESQTGFVNSLADALSQALERATALDDARAANERLSFLAEASVVLSRSLDYRDTLSAVARLLVPRLADWCVIQVLEGSELTTVALTHHDPAKVEWAEQMSGRYPTDMDAPSGVPNVIRTGRSELYAEIPDELLVEAAVDDEHLELIRGLGMSSVLVVPLTGRMGTFGAITLIHAESGRRYSESDIVFVEDVALRAALAVETAHAFREQSGRLAEVTRIAETAQLAILAPPPEQIGPVALAARYVSAAAEARVGGDLYEVVARPGAVRLLIGDVRGKGLAAVRTATVVLGEFRAAAADLDDLVDVAVQIDRRVRPYLADEDFVTALIAEIRDDGTFSIASCGHPPALVATSGSVEEIETAPSLPLGLGAQPELTTGRLDPGDRLLLYTDGVIEARDPSGATVELLPLIDPLRVGDHGDVLDAILDALHDAVGPDLGDDVALLVAEYRG